jgi:sterol desaturase/sphingolipid hydroxylase (fatty acid hydroxylase superfamily)
MTLGASAALERLTGSPIGVDWARDLPVWIAAPLIFVIMDFGDYWVHRFAHLPLMWPLHAVHHAADELTGLTSGRHQFVSGLIGAVPFIVPPVLLGFQPEAIAPAMVISTILAYWIHTDLPFPLWLERHILGGVRLHRVHHASAPELCDKNFGGLVWWDKLFGTYHLVEDHRAVAIGVGDPRFDTGRPLRDCLAALAIWADGLGRAASSACEKPARDCWPASREFPVRQSRWPQPSPSRPRDRARPTPDFRA